MMQKKLIVVIHMIEEISSDINERTLHQAHLAFQSGACGIFLTIGEGSMRPETILGAYFCIRRSFPDKFIGINFMCDCKTAATLIPDNANALWIDKGQGSINYLNEINAVKAILKERGWNGLYFGGFCLKGNNQTLFENESLLQQSKWDPENYFDVCVTSGASTGVAIDQHILSIVKSKTNGVPLALASGVNVHNIHKFLEYCDYFIVGTGVEKSSLDSNLIEFYRGAGLPDPVMIGHLDVEKITALVNILSTI